MIMTMNENKATNPGIGYLLLERKVKELEKTIVEKDAIILRQNQELKVLLSSITLKGWWCMKCDIWNGEEHSKREECRHCGTKKT